MSKNKKTTLKTLTMNEYKESCRQSSLGHGFNLVNNKYLQCKCEINVDVMNLPEKARIVALVFLQFLYSSIINFMTYY